MVIHHLRLVGILCILLLSILPEVFCECYKPDGTLAQEPEYQACSSHGGMCCALGRSHPPGGDFAAGYTQDQCLPNGLCENLSVSNGIIQQTFWRGLCSDSEWNNATCLTVCLPGTALVDALGNVRMTPCDGTPNSTKWCCGEGTACCAGNALYDAIVLPQTLGEPEQTSSAPSTTTTTGSFSIVSFTDTVATNTSDPIPTPAFPNAATTTTSANTLSSSTQVPSSTGSSGKTGLSTGAKAGISLGAVAGAFLLLSLGFFVAKALQWKRKASARREKLAEAAPPYEVVQFRHINPAHPTELDTYRDPHELPVPKVEELQRQEV